ncbi:MAG TPA: DinB family protein [Gemmatimonadaceae bacterium]
MDIAKEFLAQSRRYLASEYPTKIQRCLDVLPADAIWRRDDEDSNSIGNLLLHLSGNIRQWIVSGVGGAPDVRQRRAEFDAHDGGDAPALMERLLATVREADDVLASLDAERLAETRTIQGRDVKVLDAVYHVVEHFSMHTGQIILLAKRFAPGRVQFYEDAGGLARPRF